MHAVVVNVTVNDQETAVAMLRDQVVPARAVSGQVRSPDDSVTIDGVEVGEVVANA